jgi:hypothetical protein
MEIPAYHNKKIKTIKTTSSRKTPNYEIRKEHLVFEDGSTMDRVICYTFGGRYIGGVHEAEKYVEAQKKLAASKIVKSKPK